MQIKIKRYLLERIEREWKSLPAESRPWGVWIRFYPPLRDDICNIDVNSAIPLQVWFLDKDGISERSVWEFQRFKAVHWEQLWCGRIFKEPSLPITTGHHEIGFAAFAGYEESSDVYFDWFWGRLCGRGWRIKFDASGEAVGHDDLWIS